MDKDIEHIKKCPVCNSENNISRFEKHGLGYNECKECGLYYANPRPSQEAISSRLEIWGNDLPASAQYLQDRINFHSDRVNILKQFITNGKILDFGSGDGSFVKAAINAGFDTVGVEKALSLAEFARRNYHVKIIDGGIQNINLPANTFDAITMWDVLEHLPNPVEICSILANLLLPNGYLFIQTPHYRGISAVAQKKINWWVFGPYDHLCLFSIKTIKILSTQVDLSIKYLGTKDLVPWNPPGYQGDETTMSKLWYKLSRRKNFLKIISLLNLGDWLLLIGQKGGGKNK